MHIKSPLFHVLCGAVWLVEGVCLLQAETNPASTPITPAEPASVPQEIGEALQLPDGKEKNAALSTALKTWAGKDPIACLAWMVTLPPPLFAQAMGDAKVFVQGADAKKSADWLVQQGSKPALELLHPLLIAWALNDPVAAGEWCTRLESKDAHARDVAFFSVADGLCRKKPELAATWTAQLPPGDDRNSAVDGTVCIWIRGDIVAATTWIKTFGLPEIKRAAQRVSSGWRFAKGTKDSPNPWKNAQEWLDQLPLSQEDKDFVLKNPPH